MQLSKPTLADLLTYHMDRRGYGDHKLATLTNKKFPELQLNRANIRNWREGRANTVRDWRQLASVACALDLTETETNQLLVVAQWSDVQQLWQTAAETDKKYLDYWIHPARPNAGPTIQINQYVQQNVNQAIPPSPEPTIVVSRRRNYWLMTGLVLFATIVIGTIVSWQNRQTTNVMQPTLPPQEAITPEPQNQPETNASNLIPSALATSTPTKLETVGVNSFETAEDVTSWEWRGHCQYSLPGNFAAHTGQNYLAVLQEPDNPCHSFAQTVQMAAESNDLVRFGGWIAAPGSTAVNGRFSLNLPGNSIPDTETTFSVNRNLWHCVETSLTVPEEYDGRVEALVALGTEELVTYHFDDLELTTGNEPICPPTVTLPWIDDLESSPLWQTHGNCEMIPANGDAHSGQTYLNIQTANPDCDSIYRDFLQYPQTGETYHLAAWVRVPGDEPAWGELVLWTGSDPINLHGISEKANTQFTVYGNRWHCVETFLPIKAPDQNSLRVELYFQNDNAEYHVDDVQLSQNPICEDFPPTTLQDGDFEDEPTRIYWTRRFETCQLDNLANQSGALSGQRYLLVEDPGDGCHSIYQDVYNDPEVGQTYYFSAWVRSANGLPWNGGIVLWAEGSGGDRGGHNFIGEVGEWQCLETAVTIKSATTTHLRPELYIHSAGRNAYYLDNAQLTATPQCAKLQVGKVQNLAQHVPGPVYAGATVPVTAEIVAADLVSVTGNLNFWIADSENGDALNQEVGSLQLPPLLPGQTVWPFYEDIYLPVGLPAGNYYIVLEPHLVTEGEEVEGSGVRASMPITVSDCVAGPMYCDISADYWALPELQNWFDLGISRGCRSQTEVFVNRPFCPDKAVEHAVLAVFLLRHLYGSDFQPPETYQGYFVDVPAEHEWALWVEAFQQAGISLTRPDCPPTVVGPAFCPDKWVSKGDLARYLAELLAWELPATAVTTPFTDVSGDSLEARAIAYMWANGMIAENEPDCDPQEAGRQFCPRALLTRALAAVYLSRAFPGNHVEEGN